MIVINADKSIFSQKFYPYLFDYSHRVETFIGSAGSGKSYFIASKILMRAMTEKITILVTRRYATTLRNSVFSLFKEITEKWKISQFFTFNESDLRIKLTNGSKILFIGLDSEEKLLSLNDISTIWVEEATEINRDLFDQLNLRMRGRAKNQQIILSANPISKHNWLYSFTQNPPQSFILIHSTYKDNPWLSEEYVKSLEELYIRNPQKARVFCDGEWGVDSEGLVFQNWTVDKLDRLALAKQFERRAGCDFGYIDPSAVTESFYDRNKKIIYVTREFFKTGQTLDELYLAIKRMGLERQKIYCDSAEPRSIDFLKSKGVPAYPCIKGADSVRARILFLQNHKIVVDESCTNLIDELQNFSYEKDRDGNFTEKTTHEFSHLIDALSYGYSDIYTKTPLRTLDKSVLGL